jgi:hypothetical protein
MRGVTALPLKQNLVPRFERRKNSKRDIEQSHVLSLRQLKIWMARIEKIFTLLCCFFYHMVAPLDLVELGHLAPCDTTLLVQDLARMLGICHVCLKRCHFRQYNIHECLQLLLQLRYVEDIMNSCQ